MQDRIFFNAHHSPIGAFASLTCGCRGAEGGMAAELKEPAGESIWLGLERADKAGWFHALPFYGTSEDGPAEDYDVQGLNDFHLPNRIAAFPDSAVSREIGPAIDQWHAADLTVNIYNQVAPVPDPESAGYEELRARLMPAVIVDMTVDNRSCATPRKVFFGVSGDGRTRNLRILKTGRLVGIAQGAGMGIATLEPGAYAGVGFQPESILTPRFEENLEFTLGSVGMTVILVPAGEVKTVRFAAGVFSQGKATTGLDAEYFYQSLFRSLEEVLQFALDKGEGVANEAIRMEELVLSRLGPVRSRLFGHAVKSYYGSTQILQDQAGKPIWVVNEGEYRMMNTFDLTVDQLFYELALNPWTVKNVLDLYADRYSYSSEVGFPGSEAAYPGGVSFTHDMGSANHFSPAGRSCYEQAGLTGVFSYMTAEELVNWILCACLYFCHTGDQAWLSWRGPLLGQCLASLANRDHPDEAKRSGVVSMDSVHCRGGAEITTYDSLDPSLGQARNNLYLAVKTWAAYALMEPLFASLGQADQAEVCARQADRCAKTVVESADADGRMPAVIGEGNEARIIPAVEGLIYPYAAGRSDLLDRSGRFGALVSALERHFDLVLKPGVCLFPDGGWKLSSTSDNSWLSKIHLCQAVAEKVFGRSPDTMADDAHWRWLTHPESARFAWSDQMVSGIARGSRYYPRGVTAVLWLSRGAKPLDGISQALCPELAVARAQP